MKNKKLLLVAIILLLILFLALFFSKGFKGSKESEVKTGASFALSSDIFLDGYPLEQVPIYQASEINSFSFFVNNNPDNLNLFFDKNQNYYNVVYKTDINQEDILNYYISIMDSVNENFSTSIVEGMIDKYRVSVSHYGGETKNVYLHVQLPSEEYLPENRYFVDYPAIVEINPEWFQIESRYTKTTDSGGQIQYGNHYNVSSNLDDEQRKYEEIYASKDNFIGHDDTIVWTEGEYDIRMNFARDHGRVYMSISQPLK